MAIGAGMTSAIMNPLHAEEMAAIRGADVMMGHDPDCTRWIRSYREPAAQLAEVGEMGRRGREGRRRRRA
jgi:5-methyltetrahydrofolate--homocysteine methyltransferase